MADGEQNLNLGYDATVNKDAMDSSMHYLPDDWSSEKQLDHALVHGFGQYENSHAVHCTSPMSGPTLNYHP